MGDCDAVAVGALAPACKFGVDAGLSSGGELGTFDDESGGAAGADKAAAARVERAGGQGRVVGRGEGAHGGEGEECLGVVLLGADDDDALQATETDLVHGVAEGVAGGGAGGDEAADGAVDVEVGAEVKIEGAGDGADDAHGGAPLAARGVELAEVVVEQAGGAGGGAEEAGVRIVGDVVRRESGVGEGLSGGAERKDAMWREAAKGFSGNRVGGGPGPVARVGGFDGEFLDGAGEFYGQIGVAHPLDAGEAVAAFAEAVGDRGAVVADRGDEAEPCDDGAVDRGGHAHAVLFCSRRRRAT